MSWLLRTLVGWMICGSIMMIGPQIVSMETTLWIHLFGAALAFFALMYPYFRRRPEAAPVKIAAATVGLIIALDVVVVAMLIEGSFEMFSSPLGTWIPFAGIFAAVWSAGAVAKARAKG